MSRETYGESLRLFIDLFKPLTNSDMKSKLLLSLLFCFCIIAKAENNPTNLVVWAKDGTKVAYALLEKPKVTFTETELIITSNGVEVNYALENMARFTYEDNTATAITNLQTDESSFKLDGESLLFPALKANSTVSVYSLNGALVFKKVIRKNGEYAFPLSNMKAGVYMVNVNGLTYKIVKR